MSSAGELEGVAVHSNIDGNGCRDDAGFACVLHSKAGVWGASISEAKYLRRCGAGMATAK